MPKKKFYVVWKGKKAGIFDTWKECEEQIKGIQGAVYKSFDTPEDARKAFNSDWKDYIFKNAQKKT